MIRSLVGLLVAVSLGASAAEPAKPPAKPASAAAPDADYLNAMTRQLLRRRMARHGKDLTTLVQSVVLLKYEFVADLAKNIAEEPRLVRPTAGETDQLNSALPEKFFVLQDELRAKAKLLAETAAKKDTTALAESFGALTQSCISCHSSFLQPH